MELYPCRQCGKQVGPGEPFCAHCGALEPAARSDAPVPTETGESPVSELKGFFGVLALSIVGAIVAFTVILIASLQD